MDLVGGRCFCAGSLRLQRAARCGQSTSANATGTLPAGGLTSQAYSDASIADEQKYYYAVTTMKGGVETGPSNHVSGKPLALLTLTAPANGAIEAGGTTCSAGATCDITLSYGPVTISATPEPGFYISAWGGACTGSSVGYDLDPATMTCGITINGSISASARTTADDPCLYDPVCDPCLYDPDMCI